MTDWKAGIALVTVILVFIYAGIWWGIGVFIVVSVILGWKDRHRGPFPTNQTLESDEKEVPHDRSS